MLERRREKRKMEKKEKKIVSCSITVTSNGGVKEAKHVKR